jgi:hypothetical protein
MGAKTTEWVDYFSKRLAEAEKELANFESAITKHKLRVFHRDVHGERDVTEQHRQDLQSAIAEYRAAMRDD